MPRLGLAISGRIPLPGPMFYLLADESGDTNRTMKTYAFMLGVMGAVSLCVLGCGDNADDDGGLWWTPQTCGPEGFETCAAPSGEAMTSCP